MDTFDLQRISALLTGRLRTPTDVVSVEQIGSGYHSDGYKLTASDGRAFFLKRVKSRDLGFEFPERQIASLLVGHGMAGRGASSGKPIAVTVRTGNALDALPELADDSDVWHIQEFAPLGESAWDRMQKRKEKEAMDDEDEREISEIVRVLVEIHARPLPFDGVARKSAVYEDALRAPLSNPELTLKLLQDFPDDHPIIPAAVQDAHVAAMHAAVRRWRERGDRLRTLHGDFWGANVFFASDGRATAIDFSRIPYGDPGIDVGWWMCQYLWFFHETGNAYWKALGERFLVEYAKRAGDDEIRRACTIPMGFHGVVYVTPRFFPDLDIEAGRRFYGAILRALTMGEFSW